MLRDKNKDDLLVELLANPRLGYADIGRCVGLPQWTIGRIARGETRKDLQPMIRAAVEKIPLDKRRRKNGKYPRVEDRPWRELRKPADISIWGGVRSKKRIEYDDDLLINLISRGNLTYKQIAREVGISPTTVHHIVHGLRRPDLQRRLGEAIEAIESQRMRMGACWLKRLLEQHIREGLDGDGETARKCREYVMNQLLDSCI